MMNIYSVSNACLAMDLYVTMWDWMPCHKKTNSQGSLESSSTSFQVNNHLQSSFVSVSIIVWLHPKRLLLSGKTWLPETILKKDGGRRKKGEKDHCVALQNNQKEQLKQGWEPSCIHRCFLWKTSALCGFKS